MAVWRSVMLLPLVYGHLKGQQTVESLLVTCYSEDTFRSIILPPCFLRQLALNLALVISVFLLESSFDCSPRATRDRFEEEVRFTEISTQARNSHRDRTTYK